MGAEVSNPRNREPPNRGAVRDGALCTNLETVRRPSLRFVLLFITAWVRLGSQTAAMAQPPLPMVDHSAWETLLVEFVDSEHRVDYSRLKSQGLDRLEAYTRLLAEAGASPLPPAESKAALINAYNSLTVLWIVRNYPTASIMATPNPFKARRHKLGGESVSLDEMETRLRGTGDPRIHAVLVCAARSCPPLRREAYVAERLDEQLDDNTRAWFADERLNTFDPERGSARMSPILKWYREDFDAYPGGLQGFVRRFAPSAVRERLGDGKLRVSFQDYDWGLNDQSEVGENYSAFRLAFDWLWNRFR